MRGNINTLSRRQQRIREYLKQVQRISLSRTVFKRIPLDLRIQMHDNHVGTSGTFTIFDFNHFAGNDFQSLERKIARTWLRKHVVMATRLAILHAKIHVLARCGQHKLGRLRIQPANQPAFPNAMSSAIISEQQALTHSISRNPTLLLPSFSTRHKRPQRVRGSCVDDPVWETPTEPHWNYAPAQDLMQDTLNSNSLPPNESP